MERKNPKKRRDLSIRNIQAKIRRRERQREEWVADPAYAFTGSLPTDMVQYLDRQLSQLRAELARLVQRRNRLRAVKR